VSKKYSLDPVSTQSEQCRVCKKIMLCSNEYKDVNRIEPPHKDTPSEYCISPEATIPHVPASPSQSCTISQFPK
jgi:hypothetical protein